MAVRFYEGERIRFRPIELEDEPQLRTWVNDPRNWATLGRSLPINGRREREWIESLYANDRDVVFGVVVRKEDRLIGTTGLHRIEPIHRRAEFGVCIGDVEYQSRGYGSEAVALTVKFGFEVMNLNRIALGVFAENERARRAYEKAGFVQEGVYRQAFYRNGRWHDEVRYAVLRDEWLIRQTDAAHYATRPEPEELVAV
jgi:RimJ/RimL family protein N-acetyltransferase